MTEPIQPGGVDFHCHLDLYSDHVAAIGRAEAARIYTLTVTTTPKAWARNLELTRNTLFVRSALGLHPQLVAERAEELSLWRRYLPEARFVGEVGLDAGPRFYKTIEIQKRVFRAILEQCAEAGGKILTVHSLRSVPAVLDSIESYLPRDRGHVVLHWFTGSTSEARRAVELGCYFSVNGEMTRSDRGRALVAGLPIDRILTETDGPFTSAGHRPAEPRDVAAVTTDIAQLKNLPLEAVSGAILTNLRRLVT